MGCLCKCQQKEICQPEPEILLSFSRNTIDLPSLKKNCLYSRNSSAETSIEPQTQTCLNNDKSIISPKTIELSRYNCSTNPLNVFISSPSGRFKKRNKRSTINLASNALYDISKLKIKVEPDKNRPGKHSISFIAQSDIE